MKIENKILIVTVLILVSGLLIGWKYFQEKKIEIIPPEFQERYNKLSQWLDKKLSEWKPKEYKPMSFCA